MRGDLEQLIKESIKSALLETNTQIPAVITKWNEADDTVNVKLSIKRLIGLKSEIFGDLVEEQQETQELEDVPVYRVRNAIYAETSPIEVGDRCMIQFMQRNINCWWAVGDKCEVVDYHDTRKHHISDAVAMVGLYPLMDFIPEINMDWKESRTIDALTRSAMKLGEGLWNQDDITHQRISRSGYEVWRDGIGYVDTVIELTRTLIKKTDQLIIAFSQLKTAYDQKKKESDQLSAAFTALSNETNLTSTGVYTTTATVNAESATSYGETATKMQETVDVLEVVKSELESELEKFTIIRGAVDIPEPEVAPDPEPVDAPPKCNC